MTSDIETKLVELDININGRFCRAGGSRDVSVVPIEEGGLKTFLLPVSEEFDQQNKNLKTEIERNRPLGAEAYYALPPVRFSDVRIVPSCATAWVGVVQYYKLSKSNE